MALSWLIGWDEGAANAVICPSTPAPAARPTVRPVAALA